MNLSFSVNLMITKTTMVGTPYTGLIDVESTAQGK